MIVGSLPQMSETVETFKQPIILQTVIRTTVDFVDEVTIVDALIEAVVQVAKPEDLLIDQIDTSARYIKVHSISNMVVDQYIVYKNLTYKIIDASQWDDYGYLRAIAQEWKGDIR